MILSIKKGNKNAFEELFNIYKNKGLQTAYLIVGNRHTSEDVVQDTFVQCYFQIKNLQDPSKFKFWFYKILTRTAWKHCSKDKKNIPTDHIFDAVDHIGQEMDTEIKVLKNAESERLFQAINHLGFKQKMVIVLFYFNQMSISEIAKTLGIFEGTVKSRLHSAKKCLYSELEHEEIFNERSCGRNG